MTPDLLSIFDFIKFASRLRAVTRANNATPDRKESVAEHSWHLALTAWVLHDTFQQEFGVSIAQDRVIKMCLMHDLVEIVVGDVSIFSPTLREVAANQEEAAAQEIFAKVPPALGEEMLGLWHEFEAAETLEGKIARAIDRINPALMRLLTEQGWADANADSAWLDRIQLPRHEFSTTMLQLYQSVRDEAIAKGLLPTE
jgi:putative hydrolases of HD superfamily